MTRLWLAAGALLLASCNLAYSPTPIFTAADAGNAPHLKPGLWRNEKDCASGHAASHCEPDTGPMLITATRIQMLDKDGRPDGKDAAPWPYLIVPGSPMLVQIKVESSDAAKETGYLFTGLEPLARDPDGAITRAQIWLVECGPPEGSSGSKAPLPGMTMVGSDCTPRDRAVLLDAAARSRAWGAELLTMSWTDARPQPVAGGGPGR